MMTFADLIRQFFDKSGLQVNEYAESIGYSTTQLSNVLNGAEPGSRKMLEACLREANRDLEACLKYPAENTDREEELIGRLLFILRNDPEGSTGIQVNIDYIYEESRRRVQRDKRQQAPKRAPPVKQRRA